MPPVNTIWGLLFFALFAYLITFCIIGSVHYWANKNINIQNSVRERVIQERKKLDEKEKILQKTFK